MGSNENKSGKILISYCGKDGKESKQAAQKAQDHVLSENHKTTSSVYSIAQIIIKDFNKHY
jgi:hypothetical protein